MKSSSLQLSSQPFSRHDSRAAATAGNFPQTDYDYQATADVRVAAPSADRSESLAHVAEIRSFRLLSKRATSSGSRWESALEATAFSLIVGLMAWSLISLLIVLAQTARG